MLDPTLTRRRFVSRLLATGAGAALGAPVMAQAAPSYPEWVAHFEARALARGISAETYRRVMGSTKPDTSVYAQDRAQPEFNEAVWQYLNRRVSDWRIRTGRERLGQYGPLFARIEHDYGVNRYALLGLWGMESAFGDVIDNPKLMRPVIPALAALAWGEPRRRPYWETELLNALVIVQRGWAEPEEMIGSWAGAMGHTQWMPEVWLHMGVDYNRDGRISPFGPPDDALAGTAQYMLKRGKYRRGEAWGVEVRVPPGLPIGGVRPLAAWQAAGVTTASGRPFPPLGGRLRLWSPVSGGPAFLLGPNFYAIRSYNPSNNYALAIAHLGDRIRGAEPFVQPFPGGERTPTIAELQEIQRRLMALGYQTGGADGRIGTDTMRAVRAFQERVGLAPADGYAGLRVLSRLREVT